MPSNHLILCCPLLLLSIFPSIRWAKYWSFSFSISASNEYSGLISFKMDWFDLLAVQGTLKSLLQHHSSKASILPCSVFFMVQLSHPYVLLYIIIRLYKKWDAIFTSTRVFYNEAPLHIRRSEYWSFSISPSDEYSGLISFKMDWFDLLAAQQTLKSLLQHHNSKTSILRHSA